MLSSWIDKVFLYLKGSKEHLIFSKTHPALPIKINGYKIVLWVSKIPKSSFKFNVLKMWGTCPSWYKTAFKLPSSILISTISLLLAKADTFAGDLPVLFIVSVWIVLYTLPLFGRLIANV